MIVEMVKAYVVVRASERDGLLDALGKLSLMHLEPVATGAVEGGEDMLGEVEQLDRAMSILAPLSNGVEEMDMAPVDAAREAIRLWSTVTEGKNRLNDLERQAGETAPWGNVTRRQLEKLGEGGIELRFFRVPREFLEQVRGECMHVTASFDKKHLLVAVIDRWNGWMPPHWAEPVDFPSRDRPSILAEAAQIHESIRNALARLSKLASLVRAMREERKRLSVRLEHAMARKGGLGRGELFAVQGWVPAAKADSLSEDLGALGVTAGVRLLPVGENETPPTLVHYPAWARPMKGLFDMLGTLPGYREADLSPFFMVALPIFAALLVGDAGYGLLLTLAGIVFYRRLAQKVGKPRAQLLVVFGVTCLLWGVLTAGYFGVTPEVLALKGGFVMSGAGGGPDYEALWKEENFYAQTVKLMTLVAPLWHEEPEVMRRMLIQVSLILGCLHLVTARLRRLIGLFPDQRALAELGWAIVVVDVLVLVWYLLFAGLERLPSMVWWVLGGGFFLVSAFTRPSKKLSRRFGIGFASSLLPLLSTFGDTMSYLRLFAVGLASAYIAAAFNMLGGQLAETAGWLAGAPVIVFGHALNMVLAAIAIFAHGVRLNMLEFSNAAGVQWSGYPYRPFGEGHEETMGSPKS